ncbi:MAG: hypothetical protein RLZZ298_2081 [Pseudomonadota bacterium]
MYAGLKTAFIKTSELLMNLLNQPRAQFSVCPHDTAKNQLGWFTLNTYLQRKLSVRMHFSPQDDFLKERAHVLSTPHDLVYANPYSAAVFSRELGFLCVARPLNVFDESLIIVRQDFELEHAQRPLKVASATDKLITNPLGIRALEAIGLSQDALSLSFVGNHLNAVKAVLDGSASLGIVFNETWAGVSELSKSSLKVLTQSSEKKASHCFMVSPAWAEKRTALQDLLCNMQDDPSGKRILDDLNFKGFEAISSDSSKALEQYL